MIDKNYVIQALAGLYFLDNTELREVISAIVIRGQNIGFSIEVDNNKIIEAQRLRTQAQQLLENLTGYRVTIVITNSVNGKDALTEKTETAIKQIPRSKINIVGVKKVICVSSGKGGVGKSTITALIAQTLKSKGYNVGIADLDILGPSIPKIFGIEHIKLTTKDNKFIPADVQGIKIMSIGLLIEQTKSLIWRGPMVSKIINQLLCASVWANSEQDLDFLIIDTPPGTGDVHLSLLEKYYVDKVVVVSTPQNLAIIDAAKSLDMYQKFNIPIAGVIENMAFLKNRDGNNIFIFGRGGGQKLAKQYNVTFLDLLPLVPKIVDYCDQGKWLNDILLLDKTIDAIKN